jgi:alginate O-acetyltransferase complex protein AlgI
MVFNSLTFLIFFALVLAIHNLPLSWRTRKLNLLLASYVFYAAWNPPFVVLLWISTLVDWLAAAGMGRATTRTGRRLCLALSLAVNLGLLGFFKYGGFAVRNFAALLQTLGIAYQPAAPDFILPVGISFYTFQTLSYTLDVYRGTLRPVSSLLDFSLYVTFFPQLVAGPIVRAADFLPQLRTPRIVTADHLGWGLALLLIGLAQKVILADACLAPVVDKVFAATAQAGGLDAWVGVLSFSAQIFFDFAGYSTCALGAAHCFGFVLMDNFRCPYGAVGFSDFWRRWHISLSTWLRDYLYISLGGNRRGSVRTGINLMATMLLGGLWHGASWMFVIWGGLHGLYLLAERGVRHVSAGRRWRLGGPPRWLVALGTYALVCVAWVFFRAPDLATANRLLHTMLLGGPNNLWIGELRACAALLIVLAMLVWHGLMRDRTLEEVLPRVPWPARSLALATLLLALCLSHGDGRAFIYFQF